MATTRAIAGMTLGFAGVGVGAFGYYDGRTIVWIVVGVVLLIVAGLLLYFTKPQPSTEPIRPEGDPGQYGQDGFGDGH
jgi:hypothetical protein